MPNWPKLMRQSWRVNWFLLLYFPASATSLSPSSLFYGSVLLCQLAWQAHESWDIRNPFSFAYPSVDPLLLLFQLWVVCDAEHNSYGTNRLAHTRLVRRQREGQSEREGHSSCVACCYLLEFSVKNMSQSKHKPKRGSPASAACCLLCCLPTHAINYKRAAINTLTHSETHAHILGGTSCWNNAGEAATATVDTFLEPAACCFLPCSCILPVCTGPAPGAQHLASGLLILLSTRSPSLPLPPLVLLCLLWSLRF